MRLEKRYCPKAFVNIDANHYQSVDRLMRAKIIFHITCLKIVDEIHPTNDSFDSEEKPLICACAFLSRYLCPSIFSHHRDTHTHEYTSKKKKKKKKKKGTKRETN